MTTAQKAAYDHVITNLQLGNYVIKEDTGDLAWRRDLPSEVRSTVSRENTNSFKGLYSEGNTDSWSPLWEQAKQDFKAMRNSPLYEALS